MRRKEQSGTAYPNNRPLEDQPKWRRDFPIDINEDNTVARRDFVRFLVLVSGAFVVGQLWIAFRMMFRAEAPAPAARRIAAVADIPIGGAVSFTYPGDNDHCLLVRPDAETFVAYDQQCTHLQCAVVPDVAQGLLLCPCHNGSFELATGRARTGPPRRALPRVTLELRDGAVFATGVETRV